MGKIWCGCVCLRMNFSFKNKPCVFLDLEGASRHSFGGFPIHAWMWRRPSASLTCLLSSYRFLLNHIVEKREFLISCERNVENLSSSLEKAWLMFRRFVWKERKSATQNIHIWNAVQSRSAWDELVTKAKAMSGRNALGSNSFHIFEKSSSSKKSPCSGNKHTCFKGGWASEEL